MIDTIKLHLKDYAISEDTNIQVQPSSYVAGTGEQVSNNPLFQNSSGAVFYGSKAYLNTDNFNLSIKPMPSGSDNPRVANCFVQFSVPKNHYGNNFYSASCEETKEELEKLETSLKDNGIRTNLKEAELSRVDTFKNIQPEERFSSYYSLFSLLKARRAVQRGYGTTFLLSNSQQEFCVYDKNEEMKLRGVDLSKFPENTMRFEHRLLNKSKVSTVYGFSKAGELFKGGYEVVREKRAEAWKKSLFCYEVPEVVMLGSKALEEEMRAFKEKFPRNWFQFFLQAYGAYHLAQKAGIEVIELALQNLESERTKVWRAKKILTEAKKEIEFVKKEQNSERSFGELYEELRSKVCLN